MRWVAMFTWACGVVAACGNSGPSLSYGGYTYNCGADSDCIPIATATECTCPLCNNRAINRLNQQAYQSALAQYMEACKGTVCSNMTCPTVVTYCDNGTCETR